MNIKLVWSFIIAISLGSQLTAQKLSSRQGQVLVEVRKGSIPNRSLQVLKNQFGDKSTFLAQQVIADPMNIWQISFDFASVSERQVLNTLGKLSTVYNAQLNHITSYRKVPNDPLFGDQWQYINLGLDGGLENADIDIDEAWDVTTGGITSTGDTIVACIIDDGFEKNHEDFGANIWVNHGEIPNNNLDDDNNGYVDDYRGWNSYGDDDDIFSGGNHGTPVAGIIGAKGNNEVGVSGVNWDVKLMIVKGGGDEANALAAYAYPYIMRKKYNETNGDEGAFVVTTNSSWGTDFGQPEDAPLWCNFYDSLGMVGIISSAATVNDNVNVDEVGDLPTACSSDFIIAVSNVDRTNSKVISAGYGKSTIDIGAYGSETYTTDFGNGYSGFGGTSAAAPHVSGAVALMYALPYPELMQLARDNPAQAARLIKLAILEGSKKADQFQDIFLSGGVLNLKNSFRILNSVFSDCPFPLQVDVALSALDSAIVTWETPENALSFDLRYKRVDNEDWIEEQNVTSPHSLNGLDTCGLYEIQLKSYCDMDSTSDFSFSTKFTTLGCCLAPALLEFTNEPELVPSNAILLTWADDPDHIEYYVDWRLSGEAAWSSDTTVSNVLLIENLNFCALYEVRVKARCITGIDTEYGLTIEAVTACGNCSSLDYCPPPGVVTFGEWIESVTIDGQTMITGDNGGYRNNSGYFDVDLNIGSDIEFKLDKGFDGGTFQEWVKVWVDLDINGEFSGDELVFDEGMATVDDIDEIIRLTDVFNRGYTLMRVAMVFVDEPIACLDDEYLGAYGEYEDFCVRLVGPCDYGLSIESVVPQETEATVTFTMVDTSIAYNVRYKKVEDSEEEWETISVIDTFAQITSLEECTNYNVQVRAVCDVDTSGFMAVEEIFTTLGTDCTVSTYDVALQQLSIQALPNPFINDLSLKIEHDFYDVVRIDIINMNGQIVHTSSTQSFIGEMQIRVQDAASLSPGVYFLRVSSEAIETTIKVIKLAD